MSSNKVSAFVVILKEDVVESYFEKIKEALRLYDGVIDVKPYIEGSDLIAEMTAASRERRKWIDDLIDLIKKPS